MNRRRYWVLKTEPTNYSIDDLERDRKTPWSGVRSYMARNAMRDMMQMGDTVLIYHSSCDVPGIYGFGQVVSAPYGDPTQFDPESPYYDARADADKPIWQLVDIAFRSKLDEPITLLDLRARPGLKTLRILARGNRVSVTRVSEAEFRIIHAMAVKRGHKG